MVDGRQAQGADVALQDADRSHQSFLDCSPGLEENRMMSEQFFGLLVLALLVGFWLDSARSREQAVRHCTRACRDRGVQFLDQTVALTRLGLAWSPRGLRLRRSYRFDFSVEGVERHSGEIRMLGTQLERFSLGILLDDAEVIPARGPTDPTLH
jgi:hypothetical protein